MFFSSSTTLFFRSFVVVMLFQTHNFIKPCCAGFKNLDTFEVWRREAGWWVCNYTLLNNEGLVDYNPSESKDSGEFDYRNYFGFIKIQLVGDTLYQRNVFLRPPVNLELYAETIGDETRCRVDKLKLAGFSTRWDYILNAKTKTATPVKPGTTDRAQIETFPNGRSKLPAMKDLKDIDYSKGTEKYFEAKQSAVDNHGNLAGPYEVVPGFSVPTTTTVFGDDTVLYQVGDGKGGLSQNQLTTLPGDGTRVRTAQGFGYSEYASYYREEKIDEANFYAAITEMRNKYKIDATDAHIKTDDELIAHFNPVDAGEVETCEATAEEESSEVVEADSDAGYRKKGCRCGPDGCCV